MSSSSASIVTVTAEPPRERPHIAPRQILPFLIFGGIVILILLGFVFFSVERSYEDGHMRPATYNPFHPPGLHSLLADLSIVSNRQTRRITTSRDSEAQAEDDDLRRLDEVVPSGPLRDDRGQAPSWDSRSETVCVICLEKLVEGNAVRHLPCRHTFHTSCIDQWYRSQRYTCPICIAPYFVPP